MDASVRARYLQWIKLHAYLSAFLTFLQKTVIIRPIHCTVTSDIAQLQALVDDLGVPHPANVDVKSARLFAHLARKATSPNNTP